MKRWKLGGEEAGKMGGNGIRKAGKGKLEDLRLWGLEVEDPPFLCRDEKQRTFETGSLEDSITNLDYDCAI